MNRSLPSCIPVYMYACMYVVGVFSTHQNNSQNQCVRNGRWHCGPVKDASVGLLFGDSGNHTARRHTSLENEGDPVVLSRSSLLGVSAEYGGPGLTGWQILSCRMDTSLSPGDFEKQEGILCVGAAIFFVVVGGDRSLANFKSSAVGLLRCGTSPTPVPLPWLVMHAKRAGEWHAMALIATATTPQTLLQVCKGYNFEHVRPQTCPVSVVFLASWQHTRLYSVASSPKIAATKLPTTPCRLCGTDQPKESPYVIALETASTLHTVQCAPGWASFPMKTLLLASLPTLITNINADGLLPPGRERRTNCGTERTEVR